MTKIIKSGAEILLECLKNEGVDIVFGYPGGQVIPLYDKLYDSDIKHILVGHEQGAAHAADGYARATGKVGVCIATSGPGATNLVTGIATAYMDSIPIVAITGQVKSPLIGKDSFQEVDIVGITLPIVKHSYIVRDINELAATVKEAFHIARTGRPGPVIIDVPSDIQLTKVKNYVDSSNITNGYSVISDFSDEDIEKAVELISKAKKPLLLVGGGVITSDACSELLKFSESLNIPVVTSLMGVGAFDADHPLSLGMLGMHGTRYANNAVCNCDLLISVGARFDDRVTGDVSQFAANAAKIQIDIDEAEIGKIIPVDMGIIGDAKEILNRLMKKFEEHKDFEDRAEWISCVKKFKAEYPLKFDKNGPLKPQFVISEIYRLTEGKAIITTDVGEHQMWAAQYYKSKSKRSFITSGGLGTMGFGFPAAIGAQAAYPEKTVFSISGDGSFQMNSQELMTAVRYDLPVIVAIINNGYLGMVRQWQELFYDKRFSNTDIGKQPDFVKLAEAYGAIGMRVTEKDKVEEAILHAMELRKTVVIDFIVDRGENVYPFVPAGAPLSDMIGG